MKELEMKKSIATVLILSAVVLMNCSKTEKTEDQSTRKNVKIGVSKIIAHDALDAVERGLINKLNTSGVDAIYYTENANGDINTVAQIAARFKNEKVDIAVGIATQTAIALANDIKEIPVVFSAITDPVNAGLVDSVEHGKNNVTGVSDAIPITNHINVFKEIAHINTLGYIYTSSEDNSVVSYYNVKKACDDFGINLEVQTITNSSELKQAAQSIINRVDGIYISNDNMVFAALPSLIEVCHQAKKPLFSADVTSCKRGGAMIAMGFNYYKLGLATGDIIIDILNGKKPADIPVRFMTGTDESDFLIDLDAASECGITVPEKYIEQANMIFQNGSLIEK